MLDIEQTNRKNFRVLMDALSHPGSIGKMDKAYDSYLLSVASVLLYSEVSFYYFGEENFTLVEAVTNPRATTNDQADYIFSDAVCLRLLREAKTGDFINPDFSSLLVFKCDDFNKYTYRLRGPGIDGEKILNLPVNKEFIVALMGKNANYPLGVEVYFLNEIGEIIALSRTTKVEVL